jgi:iron only hydrogenase large subunit-like protein
MIIVSSKMHCDVIHCCVKCPPEIDWLVKQNKGQKLLLILVDKLASQRQCLQTMHPSIIRIVPNFNVHFENE